MIQFVNLFSFLLTYRYMDVVNKNSEDITSHNLNTYRSYNREYIQPIQTSCKSCDPANQDAKNQDNFIESLPYPFNILEF